MAEHFDLDLDRDERESGTCFLAVRRDPSDWPQLVVTQRFAPAAYGFDPGVLLVPETETVFIGAGERLIAYSAANEDWRRVWVDVADVGFWGWRQHGDVVLMSAELELAAWTTSGEKCWSTFVEPPWSYPVENDDLELDVMGAIRRLSALGEQWSSALRGSPSRDLETPRLRQAAPPSRGCDWCESAAQRLPSALDGKPISRC